MLIIGVCGKAGSGKDTIADILVKDLGFVKVAFADPLKRVCKDIYDFTDEQLWGPSEKRNEADFRYIHRKAGSLGRKTVSAFLPDDHIAGKVVPEGTFDRWPDIRGTESLVDADGCIPSPSDDEYLTPRYALQKLGTEWGRDCYAPTWIEYGLRVAKKLLGEGYRYKYTPQHGLDITFDQSYQKPTGVVISDVRFLNEVEGLRAGGAKLVRVHRPKAGLKGPYSEHRSETEQDDIDDDLFDIIVNNTGSLEDLVVTAHAFVSNFQVERREEGFAQMLENITDVNAAADKAALTLRPAKDLATRASEAAVAFQENIDFEMPLGPLAVDGVSVIPVTETASEERMRSLLEDRQRDVEAGKIRDYDPAQADVPPFRRKS